MNPAQIDTPRPSPALSALVVTPDTYATVRAVMQTLKQQTVAQQIELVLIVPSRDSAAINENDLTGFNSSQVVEVGNVLHASALAQGVRHARAPLVVITEDHCFPAPNWAERLIAAHAGGNYAAVGPAMRNGNPNTLTSWADFYINYSNWAEPIESGVVDFLMGHNACYRRATLLAYDERLEDALETETVLQWDMRAQGSAILVGSSDPCSPHELCAAAALDKHPLVSRSALWRKAFIQLEHRQARVIYARHTPYSLSRLVRTRRGVQRAAFPFLFRLKLYSLITFGLVVDALGQAAGYAFGAGKSNALASDHEFHRERYYNASA